MREKRLVASGTWLYDGSLARRIDVYAASAVFAGSRFDEYDHFDPTSPIPETPDGNVYVTSFGGERPTLRETMSWADGQPWGPVKWDDAG